MIDWSPLDVATEVHNPVLWWRDDDAIASTPALERLIDLAGRFDAPLMLASIPRDTTAALAERVLQEPRVTVAPHGWCHANHAPPPEKKAEFGAHRAHDVMATEASDGLSIIRSMFGAQAVAVFVPPWNRMDDAFVGPLKQAGYEAISGYGHRGISADPLPRFDAHIDPIDWRGTRSAVEANSLIRHVAGMIEDGHPIGLMTHHLVHDAAIWELTEALVERLTARGGTWVDIRSLLKSATNSAG